jgi:hypothetical protein
MVATYSPVEQLELRQTMGDIASITVKPDK